MQPSALTSHLRGILEHQGQGLVDREQTLALSLLAALAGHNVLLLGPPGTAKSLLARRLSGAFADATRFEYLLTRFTTPDELFGPVSLRALKERDALERNTQGYLPAAQVVFLDEIFKAGSAILNALLTLLNERIFFNGGKAEPAQLLVLVAASNEVPQGGELQALYDRFPLRLLVEPVRGEAAFEALLTASTEPAPLPVGSRLRVADLQVLRDARDQVGLSAGAFAVLSRLRERLGEGSPADWERRYVSDRRWRQILALLKTSAGAHGAHEVQEADCGLLRHMLWNDPQDAAAIGELVDSVLQERGMDADLDAGPVGVRWKQLLGQLALHDSALAPRVQAWVLRVGDRERRYSPQELSAAQQNPWDHVLRSEGLYWDGQAFKQLQRSGKRGWVLGDWACSSQEIWDKVLGHQEPVFDETVRTELVPELGEGAVVDLSQIPGPTRTRWLGELGVIHGTLEAQEQQRRARLNALEAQLDEHLFLRQDDVAGLRLGLERAGVEIETWRERLAELEQALMEGGRWVTSALPDT
ncbi:MAG: AAA family ATPase [Myxococcota bacterium]|nr:AAA family ATPase [Myxococcota bacterium]